MKINDITTQYLDDMVKSFNKKVDNDKRDQLDMYAIYYSALMLVNDPDLTVDDVKSRWFRHMISDDLFHCYCHLYQILYCINLEDKYFPKSDA